MKNRLRTFLLLSLLLCLSLGLRAQLVVEQRLPELEIVVRSYVSVSDEVDSLVVVSRNWRVAWVDKPVMEKEDCHSIGDLVGTCNVLSVPIIGAIERLDSNLVMLFGGYLNNALRDRQLVILDTRTGAVVGWYGYITWRGNDVCKMVIDMERRTLLIGVEENDMQEDAFYVVDREKMTIDALHAETSPVRALEISMLKKSRPTVWRKGYFQVGF